MGGVSSLRMSICEGNHGKLSILKNIVHDRRGHLLQIYAIRG